MELHIQDGILWAFLVLLCANLVIDVIKIRLTKQKILIDEQRDQLVAQRTERNEYKDSKQ